MRKKFLKNKGFTLFELLAVLAILSIIAAIAVPRVMQTIKNARIEALKNNMQMIANSMQRYCTEKELTSCLGGPFVIHPNESEVNNGGDIYYSNSGVVVGSSDGNYLVRKNDTDLEKEIEDHYIEGGIPDYIRVQVYIDANNTGHIIVSYGDVFVNESTLLHNGITVEEAGGASDAVRATVDKTFQFESGGDHDHDNITD